MLILRRFLAFLLASSLSLFLFATVLTTAFSTTITLSNIRNLLSKHHIYDNIINKALVSDKASDLNFKDEGSNLSKQDTVNALRAVFTPKVLQNITESFIDGTDPWLKGKTTTPTFKIDLTTEKNKLAEVIGETVKKRYLALPICKTGQLPDTKDPLNSSCRVNGINVDVEVKKVVNDVRNSKDFLPKTTLTAKTLTEKKKGSKKSEPIFKENSAVPKVYKYLRASPWIFGFLSLITAAGLVFASHSRRQGLRRVSVPLITTSIFLLVSILLVNWGFGRAENELRSGDVTKQRLINDSVLPILKDLKGSMEAKIIVFITLFSLLAAAIFMYLHKTRPSKSTPVGKTSKI